MRPMICSSAPSSVCRPEGRCRRASASAPSTDAVSAHHIAIRPGGRRTAQAQLFLLMSEIISGVSFSVPTSNAKTHVAPLAVQPKGVHRLRT